MIIEVRKNKEMPKALQPSEDIIIGLQKLAEVGESQQVREMMAPVLRQGITHILDCESTIFNLQHMLKECSFARMQLRETVGALQAEVQSLRSKARNSQEEVKAYGITVENAEQSGKLAW